MSEQKKERKNNAIILWFLIVFLAATNGITAWLLFTEKTKIVEQKVITEKIIIERDNVKNDLLALKTDRKSVV